MREISLHILDIVQNSIVAGGTLVEIGAAQDSAADTLTVTVKDNGRGMAPEQLERVRDPFYTTRTTRSIGLGIPLFRMAAEQSGGRLELQSEPGIGTEITAVFGLSHIDRMPLGDISSTIFTLVQGNPDIDFMYKHRVNGNEFLFDTRELRGVLEDVPLNAPDVLDWIVQCVEQGISELPCA